MKEKSMFYCFRGIVVFSNQRSLFSQGIENTKKSKNTLFKNFFDKLANQGIFESSYASREYLMLYKNRYSNMIHIQLARKSEYYKHKLSGSEIVEQIDEDYPYVNVFVETITQKFIIERNSKTFDNIETSAKVIQNIMNSNFDYNDLSIEINPIVFESDFWNLFNNGKKIYNIEFSLDIPNLFNMKGEAEKMLEDARDNVNADKVSLRLINKEGNLTIPKKDGIDSYVAFANNGGGTWSLSMDDDEGKKQTVTSGNVTKKIEINIDKIELNVNELTTENIATLINALNRIETVDSLKNVED